MRRRKRDIKKTKNKSLFKRTLMNHCVFPFSPVLWFEEFDGDGIFIWR